MQTQAAINTPGNQPLLEYKINGLLVSPGDTSAQARAIAPLLNYAVPRGFTAGTQAFTRQHFGIFTTIVEPELPRQACGS